MSGENVERTRRAYDALNGRDLEGFLALADPDVVAIPRLLWIEGGELHGHEDVRRWWEGLFEAFPDFRASLIAVEAVGDATVSEASYRGQGAESGAPFEDAVWQVTRWRDGRAVWWATYTDRAEAMAAAGRPNPPSPGR